MLEQIGVAFSLGFGTQGVELARRSVPVELLFPPLLLDLAKPLGDTGELGGGEFLNLTLDLLDPAHEQILPQNQGLVLLE